MINVQNISSKLASLPDQALKQYAEMHKEDPYVFSLALSESNRRKELRAQAQQPAPQPKVVDKELADMDIRKALPEDLGIARLPVDMSMAGGGIVAFGDGGMSHYDKGGDIQNAGSDPKLAYRQYALTQANKMGLDPALVDTIFKIESGYNPEAQSPTGPQGIGQLTKLTGKAYGVDPEERKDPYKNIDASIAYMADLNKKYAGDPSKIAVAYNQGESVLNKNLRENQGELNVSTLPKQAKDYVRKLTNLLPISSANAEAVSTVAPAAPAAPQEADRSFTGQLKDIGSGITGLLAPQGAGGYAPGTRNFFERAADQFGIPEETQRNVSNTLNALPGASILRAPAAVGKLSAAAQAAREAEIAAAAAKADAAAAKVANLRLPAPAQQGIAAIPRPATAPPVEPRVTFPLSPESVEMNQKMQAARQAQQLRNLEADKAAAEAASKGVTTAKNAAQTSEAMEMANAARAANMANKVITPANKAVAAARNIQAARVGSDVSMPLPADDKQMPQGSLGPAVYETQKSPYTYQEEQYQPQNKTEEKQIVAAAKEFLPKSEDTDGWSKNDWLQFGLAMMAGQSPHALANVGAAGLSVLAAKAEKQREQNKLDLYKTVHEQKPGQAIQIAERLMANNPSLSFEDALEKGTELTGGSNKEALAATKANAVAVTNLKNFEAAKEKLDARYQIYMNGTGPTAQAAQKRYENELQKLYAIHNIPVNTAPSAASALGWGQVVKH